MRSLLAVRVCGDCGMHVAEVKRREEETEGCFKVLLTILESTLRRVVLPLYKVSSSGRTWMGIYH